eukprot:SAG31_NODE_9129_length_1329_cov_1.491057_3_plen_260_part_01
MIAQSTTTPTTGIANSIDLTERTLPFLGQRGCSPQRLHFHPYTAEQLVVILNHRLSLEWSKKQQTKANAGNFEEDEGDSSTMMLGDNLWGVGFSKVVVEPFAVQFCAKKVAAVSGDVRKLLALCSKAITLAARDTDAKHTDTTVVSIAHVSKASTDLFGGKYVDIVRGLPLHQRVAVCAAVKLLRGSCSAAGSATATMGSSGQAKDPDLRKLYSCYTRLCRGHGFHAVSLPEFTDMCETSLVHHRILDISATRGGGGRKP